MTWKEFKDIVEAKNVTDDMELNYIDVSDGMLSHCNEIIVTISVRGEHKSFSIH